MTDKIIHSIEKTKSTISDLKNIPNKPGIYAFFLNSNANLGKFGKSGQLIYVGISEKSLNSRETLMHLKNGMTGWSTLRRSLGAILKTELILTAEKRDISSKKLRADKYKFDLNGEERLTNWMYKSLQMGFWPILKELSLDILRDEEKKIIIKLKPTLDLDRRTKKYNPLAPDLDALRAICKAEVKIHNT